jgi:hypothetical protein
MKRIDLGMGCGGEEDAANQQREGLRGMQAYQHGDNHKRGEPRTRHTRQWSGCDCGQFTTRIGAPERGRTNACIEKAKSKAKVFKSMKIGQGL